MRIPVSVPSPLPVRETGVIEVRPTAIPQVLFYYSGPFNTTPQYTIPDTELNLIQWVWVQFNTSATVGGRSIRLVITTDGNVEVARHIARSPQPPTTGMSYYWIPGVPHSSPADGSTTQYIPTAQLLLPPKWTLAVGDFLRVDDADTRTIVVVGTKIPIINGQS